MRTPNIYNKNIINQVFIINLFAAIIFCLIGFFSISPETFIPDYEWRFKYINYCIYIYITLISLLIISNIIHNFYKLKILYIYILNFFYIILTSYIINNKIQLNLIYALLFMYFIYYIKNNINIRVSNFFYYALLIFCISPVFLLIFQNYIYLKNFPPLFMFESFRGFSFDRIEYSIMAGYALILILTKDRVNYFYFSILIYGLVLSESRAGLLSLFCAINFIFYKRKALIWLNILFIIFGIILILYGNRSEALIESGGRFDLIEYSFNHIFSSLPQMLFGAGELYSSPPDSIIPHNSIIQTALNFGLIGLMFWIIFIILLFRGLSRTGKGFIIFLNIFGFMHPGFDGFYFLPMIALGYLLSIAKYSNEKNYSVRAEY